MTISEIEEAKEIQLVTKKPKINEARKN